MFNKHKKTIKPEAPVVDHRVFSGLSLATIEHLSRFEKTVPGMAEYLLQNREVLNRVAQEAVAVTTDTIHIDDSGEVTLLDTNNQL